MGCELLKILKSFGKTHQKQVQRCFSVLHCEKVRLLEEKNQFLARSSSFVLLAIGFQSAKVKAKRQTKHSFNLDSFLSILALLFYIIMLSVQSFDFAHYPLRFRFNYALTHVFLNLPCKLCFYNINVPAKAFFHIKCVFQVQIK